MSLAPWRSPLAHNLHSHRHQPEARYLQLATLRSNGQPANRTVVFRGFWGETNQLQFVTDVRSEKAGQIEQQPWAEACWYFPKTREQFRLTGRLNLVQANCSSPELQAARQTMWQQLSEPARLQFAWPHPGQPRVEDTAAFQPPPPDSTIPLPHFCLLLLDPTQVDHLELRGNPQNRWLYCYDPQQGWSLQAVNP